jgi:type III pantothenate kinase
MWLLIDIGNSASKVGLFDPTSGTERVPGEVVRTERFEHGPSYDRALRALLGSENVSRAGAVSVVPQQKEIWADTVHRVCGVPLGFHDQHSVMPIQLTYQTPDTMGHDRIAVAVAAWMRHGIPGEKGVLVLDAGTALNVEVVRRDGSYPGGIIAAGPAMVRDALGFSTAQLPLASLSLPPTPVGTSTTEALQSGILYSLLDAAAGLVRRVKEAEEGPFQVVVTGGWGTWMIEQLRVEWVYDRNLVLKGVSDLMRLAN